MRRFKNLLVGVGLLLCVVIFDFYSRRRNMKRQLFHLWLIIALLIVCASLLEGQSDGTVVVRLRPGFPSLVAETTCSEDNHVVIVFHQELDSLEYRLTMVHENVHVRQMKKDCKAMQLRYRTEPKVRIEMEREAYCEDSHARLLAGQPVQFVHDRFYTLMKMLYDVDEPVCDYIPP